VTSAKLIFQTRPQLTDAISPAISQITDLNARILMKLGPKDRSRRRALDLTKLGFTDNDLWIAASALERNAVVVSEDADFQRIAALEQLGVENWLVRAHPQMTQIGPIS